MYNGGSTLVLPQPLQLGREKMRHPLNYFHPTPMVEATSTMGPNIVIFMLSTRHAAPSLHMLFFSLFSFSSPPSAHLSFSLSQVRPLLPDPPRRIPHPRAPSTTLDTGSGFPSPGSVHSCRYRLAPPPQATTGSCRRHHGSPRPRREVGDENPLARAASPSPDPAQLPGLLLQLGLGPM